MKKTDLGISDPSISNPPGLDLPNSLLSWPRWPSCAASWDLGAVEGADGVAPHCMSLDVSFLGGDPVLAELFSPRQFLLWRNLRQFRSMANEPHGPQVKPN